MNYSDIISTIAILISTLALMHSYRTSRYNLHLKKSELGRQLEREKAEFIVRIEKAQIFFKKVEHQQLAVLEKINSTLITPQNSLDKNKVQITTDLKSLHDFQIQANSLLAETYDLNLDGLAQHKPRFLKLIEQDEKFAAKSLSRASLIERNIQDIVVID